jgi:dihydrofolate reductase
MRKVIFSIPITLDGFIEGPHRELDWVIADDELHDFYSDLLNTSDLILYGRVTYELMANYWPIAPDDPTISMGMLRFANTLNPMKKIVFSKTLRWFILLGGGASIAKLFIEYGLIDEYQLVVQPVAIGEGTSLFGGIKDMHKLEYLWYRPFQSGAVALCYRPNGKV